MSTFFHGWRRKVGCVILGPTMLFAGVWVRSLNQEDYVELSAFARRHSFDSRSGSIYWRSWDDSLNHSLLGIKPPAWETLSKPIVENNPDAYYDLFGSLNDPRLPIATCRFEIAEMMSISNDDHELFSSSVRDGEVRHSVIVIPLTLLSAYLILSKPRIAKPKPDSFG